MGRWWRYKWITFHPSLTAAAERIFSELLTRCDNYDTIILQWDAVPVLDAGGLNAFLRFTEALTEQQLLVITDIPFQPLKTLARARVKPISGKLNFYASLPEALAALQNN
ncbi:putative sulfate transporter ychM [Yersinia pestis Antiqua]|uniref:SulP family sulfate permease n=1 Tax=Yersinia pestis bv. Antiqua (strain Antiqua) TaxID=360102 RepID=A0A0E1NTI2_YERPA|nr:SulP family sulfate permease [Yersinia pestis Antiqua]AJJ80200.1 putative sulfate transporter ychM [Yersinia pestis Antiqua]AJK22152.1 putative sulfate transporter ychM [Yersinia pestis]AYX19757.1 SulP family sulfate permease [Yersinia pestis]EDR60467.1 SulP family sulfate permease [Yersinia pestis biovar Antiqua str. UG05-0454]